MTSYVLGIDSGSTAVKVSVFDPNGRVVSRGSAPTPRAEVGAGRVERNPDRHWDAVAEAVRSTVRASSIDARRISAIGLAGQGDGVQLVDQAGEALGAAILSSDTRATGVVERWAADGTLDTLRALTGQIPFPGSPAPLLRWLLDTDPDALRDASWLLSAKDWLRLRMTGQIHTDRTDASASFADADTHEYSPEALSVTGLESVSRLLPPMIEPCDVSGALTVSAAEQMGLVEGTLVVAGVHDVAATLLGSVGLQIGHLCVIVGTFGVNVMLTPLALRSASLNTRSGPTAGLWTARRTSRASTANVEWMGRIISPSGDRDELTRAALKRAIAVAAPYEPPTYIPFLFGGNAGQPDSASFFGLRSWHTVDDLARAVVEGVIFNHRHDVHVIAEELAVKSIHLAGGVVHDAGWRQLFADAFGRPISFAPGDDAGTRGAAMCAAVGAGWFAELSEATRAFAPRLEYVAPGAETEPLERRFAIYQDAVEVAKGFDARRSASTLTPEGR
ncbi:FGGY-family carbohydrate kinase [Glaciibacter superstes]|uniref:FGGY-family carbohydrate kinase n=1 Tax=Glaciibacter superstes TaxID=501023 RepID=UPI0003B4D1C5|nr:FGGY-family carbohydrate kinase [Glaciibacter superstes]